MRHKLSAIADISVDETPRTPAKTPANTDPPHLTLSPPRVTPAELYDQLTLRLPEPWVLPTCPHKYLGSIAFIQKRSLISALRSNACAVDLIERYNLDDVDIVLDPTAGIIFAPLLALPSRVESLVTKLESLSWRGTRRASPYAYSPPLLKAIKKLRRNLSIAEGCGNKNTGCLVSMAFANTVMEAAMYTRFFGDCVEANASPGAALWGPRDWLEKEEQEDEADLARVEGMNAFAAFVMLYQRTLQDIVDQSPDQRVQEFGPLIGEARVVSLHPAIGCLCHNRGGLSILEGNSQQHHRAPNARNGS
ncbi:hypothetical protein BV22DRAFT_1012523 [Leucogyrophana mollusca]|uniref:Uncharacterized protein n=1 Tax=Leucogyrophana mollusca TaxID=85980 RepID=A0ACB8BIZ7_9AGAM|nr:hypothetical protein BV22DRAFT_1012523 [Leucogyrophana mollusca]